MEAQEAAGTRIITILIEKRRLETTSIIYFILVYTDMKLETTVICHSKESKNVENKQNVLNVKNFILHMINNVLYNIAAY